MNDVSYTVLKLANGEDIICEVDFEQYNVEADLPQRIYEIQNPLLITHTKEMSPEGVREGDEYDEIVTEEKKLDDYSNDDIYDELLDEYETPSKAIH